MGDEYSFEQVDGRLRVMLTEEQVVAWKRSEHDQLVMILQIQERVNEAGFAVDVQEMIPKLLATIEPTREVEAERSDRQVPNDFPRESSVDEMRPPAACRQSRLETSQPKPMVMVRILTGAVVCDMDSDVRSQSVAQTRFK